MKPCHGAGLLGSPALCGFDLGSRYLPSPSISLSQDGSLKQPGRKTWMWGLLGPHVWVTTMSMSIQGSGDWDWVPPWDRGTC